MTKLKHLAASVALLAAFGTASVGHAVAQDDRNTTVQDGIKVRPLSRLSKLVPAEQLNEAAAQQYTQMMSQAQQKGVLLPASHPEVQRLRAIAKRIIPYTARWNQDATQWQWQVNLIDSKDVNAFCMPGGRIGFFTGILSSLKLTDDEVAAVMGHEIAHALREHSREKMAKQGLTNAGARIGGALISGIFGIDPGITGTIASYGAQFAGLKFSRDDEREADLVGLAQDGRAEPARADRGVLDPPWRREPHQRDAGAHERAAAAVRARQGHHGRQAAALPDQCRLALMVGVHE
jgi:Zn-dependent protease with chaperone function